MSNSYQFYGLPNRNVPKVIVFLDRLIDSEQCLCAEVLIAPKPSFISQQLIKSRGSQGKGPAICQPIKHAHSPRAECMYLYYIE